MFSNAKGKEIYICIYIILSYENIPQPEALIIAVDFQVEYIFVLRFMV